MKAGNDESTLLCYTGLLCLYVAGESTGWQIDRYLIVCILISVSLAGSQSISRYELLALGLGNIDCSWVLE